MHADPRGCGNRESRGAIASEARAGAGGVGPSSTATQCKSLVFQSTIFAINVSGTESSAPIGPSNQPHTNIDSSTTSGETLSERPSALGSIKLPIIRLKRPRPMDTSAARPTPKAVNARSTGGIAATKLPTVGT